MFRDCGTRPAPLAVLVRPATPVWGPSSAARAAEHPAEEENGLAFHLLWGGGQYKLDSCSASPAEKSNRTINWYEYEMYTSPNQLQCNYIQRPFLRSLTELNCYSLILQLKKAWKGS